MRIRANILAYALGQARELQFYYGSGGKKDVDRTIDVCMTGLGKNITLHANDPSLGQNIKHIRAWYEAVGEDHKSYRIYVRMPQPEVWARFSAFKELMHVVLDQKKTLSWRTVEVYPHIMDVVQNLIDSDVPKATTASEKVAELAAMEFCFPYQERLKFYDEAKAAGKELNYQNIADGYGLPEPLIRRYLGLAAINSLGQYEMPECSRD